MEPAGDGGFPPGHGATLPEPRRRIWSSLYMPDSCDGNPRPTVARSPWQNGHAERLIGSIRRECLDHVIVFGEAHLCRVLKSHCSYYNQVRTHLSLNKDGPEFRQAQSVISILALPTLGGLHHHYVRV
jgi:hypothetical protein